MLRFSLELDHVAIFTQVDAPEAAGLAALGLEGFGGTTHHGAFGTASTSFFFENGYLELFWVHDAAAAAQVFAPVGFDPLARSQWQQTGACPVGLLFCQPAGLLEPLPFPTRSLPVGGMSGDVALEFAATESAEPYVGVVPEALAYRTFQPNIPPPAHPLGVQRLTGVRLWVTVHPLSPVIQTLQAAGLVAVEPGPATLLELTFDHGVQGKRLDVRPTLPLLLVC